MSGGLVTTSLDKGEEGRTLATEVVEIEASFFLSRLTL